MSITGRQIAMARILLDMNQEELADRLEIARKTVMRIENGQSPGSATTAEKIRTFFEQNGIEFLEREGVQKSGDTVTTLTGRDGFKTFRNDVYETLKSGGTALVSNVDEGKFASILHPDDEKTYLGNMKTVKNLDFKILCEEGDYNFTASGYAKYRWTPKEQFATVPFYLYGNKLAVILFEEPVKIMIIRNDSLARAFTLQFMRMWDQAIVPPPRRKTA